MDALPGVNAGTRKHLPVPPPFFRPNHPPISLPFLSVLSRDMELVPVWMCPILQQVIAPPASHE